MLFFQVKSNSRSHYQCGLLAPHHLKDNNAHTLLWCLFTSLLLFSHLRYQLSIIATGSTKTIICRCKFYTLQASKLFYCKFVAQVDHYFPLFAGYSETPLPTDLVNSNLIRLLVCSVMTFRNCYETVLDHSHLHQIPINIVIYEEKILHKFYFTVADHQSIFILYIF